MTIRATDEEWAAAKQRTLRWLADITLDTQAPLVGGPDQSTLGPAGLNQYDEWFAINWQKERLRQNNERAFFLACAFARFHGMDIRGWYQEPLHTSIRAKLLIEIMEEAHGRIY